MQLRNLTRELDEMKKTRVKLMRQMKEEISKNKKREAERERQISQLKKESRKREIQIKNMESEKRQRELVLKRKQEEVRASVAFYYALSPISTRRIYSREQRKSRKRSNFYAANFFANQSHCPNFAFASRRAKKFKWKSGFKTHTHRTRLGNATRIFRT